MNRGFFTCTVTPLESTSARTAWMKQIKENMTIGTATQRRTESVKLRWLFHVRRVGRRRPGFPAVWWWDQTWVAARKNTFNLPEIDLTHTKWTPVGFSCSRTILKYSLMQFDCRARADANALNTRPSCLRGTSKCADGAEHAGLALKQWSSDVRLLPLHV